MARLPRICLPGIPPWGEYGGATRSPRSPHRPPQFARTACARAPHHCLATGSARRASQRRGGTGPGLSRQPVRAGGSGRIHGSGSLSGRPGHGGCPKSLRCRRIASGLAGPMPLECGPETGGKHKKAVSETLTACSLVPRRGLEPPRGHPH